MKRALLLLTGIALLAYGLVVHAQVVPAPQAPVGLACAFNSTPPALTNLQAGWVQCDSAGRLVTAPFGTGTPGVTMLTASATGTTGAVAATLTAAANQTTYICGLTVTLSNPTAATNITIAVTGTIVGTMSYTRQVLAAAATVPPPQDIDVFHNPCVPASATNTTIVVTQPGLGAGATSAATTAWGYRL